MTVPDMPKPPGPPWITQWYRNVPAVVKVWENSCRGGPPARTPESKDASSAVTEWSVPSSHFQVTVSPTLTMTLDGVNVDPTVRCTSVPGVGGPELAGAGTPTGRLEANSPPRTISNDPIIPVIMWFSTWQCMCHSPSDAS